jgi:hypothetical protein
VAAAAVPSAAGPRLRRTCNWSDRRGQLSGVWRPAGAGFGASRCCLVSGDRSGGPARGPLHVAWHCMSHGTVCRMALHATRPFDRRQAVQAAASTWDMGHGAWLGTVCCSSVVGRRCRCRCHRWCTGLGSGEWGACAALLEGLGRLARPAHRPTDIAFAFVVRLTHVLTSPAAYILPTPVPNTPRSTQLSVVAMASIMAMWQGGFRHRRTVGGSSCSWRAARATGRCAMWKQQAASRAMCDACYHTMMHSLWRYAISLYAMQLQMGMGMGRWPAAHAGAVAILGVKWMDGG